MIITPRRYRHPWSSAISPSDIGATANFNVEFNLMAVNPIIECFSKNLIPHYCHGFESSTGTAVYTVPPFFVESLHGCLDRSLPCLLLHMYAEDTIATFLTSNIYIRQGLPKALTLIWLRSYKMFKVLLIVTINISVGLQGILTLHLVRDVFLYRLVRGIPLKQEVPWPLQSKVRTPPPHLCCTIPALQISLKAGIPPPPLHCDGQWILQPLHRVQAVVAHQHL